MFGKISGLVYGYTMSIIMGWLGGSVTSYNALYLMFLMVFVSLFIAPTMIRIMSPTKKFTFFKYF